MIRNAFISTLLVVTVVTLGVLPGCGGEKDMTTTPQEQATAEWNELTQDDKDLACSVYRGAPSDEAMLELLLKGGQMDTETAQAKIDLLKKECPAG